MEPLTSVSVTVADATDLDELAAVAAATFPLACPPTSPPEDIASFIATNLSRSRFAEYLADPSRVVLVAREHRRILGYAMLVRGASDDPDVLAAVTLRPAMELSKIYVAADRHGAGVSAALMGAAVGCAEQAGARCLWLGVNQDNSRAQRFYRKQGFEIAGTKTFHLAAHTEHDFVMVRAL